MNLKTDIETIYNIYKTLDIKDIQKYIEDLSLQYFVDRNYIKTVIRKYVKTLSNEEQQEYQLIQQNLKIYQRKIWDLINSYVKSKSKTILLGLLKINSSASMNTYLDDYLTRNPDHLKKIEQLKQDLISLEQKIINKEIYKNYLESGNCLQSIINLIALLFCSQEEAILLLKRYSIPKVIFDSNLRQFEELFPDQEEDLMYLKDIYYKYAIRYRIIIEETDPFYEKAGALLEQIAASGKSILEYLSLYRGYTLKQVETIFREIRKLGNDDYNYLIKIIKARDSNDFFDHLNEIVLEIYQQENFEIADYYELTKLRPESLKKYIDNNIRDKQIKDEVFFKINRAFDSNSYFFSKRNSETQKNIIQFLKEKGISTEKSVITYYLIKYQVGELDLETGKVKRK